jgi:hypothetical protein
MHYGDTESGVSFDYCVYVDVLPDIKILDTCCEPFGFTGSNTLVDT